MARRQVEQLEKDDGTKKDAEEAATSDHTVPRTNNLQSLSKGSIVGRRRKKQKAEVTT